MRGIRLRCTLKSVIAILCAACFLTMSIGAVSHAIAQETWETWPKKPVESGAEDTTGAAMAGEEAGKKTYAGMSAGTIGLIAAGAAVVIGVAIAAGGSGGSSSSPSCSQ